MFGFDHQYFFFAKTILINNAKKFTQNHKKIHQNLHCEAVTGMYLKLISRLEAAAARVGVELLMTLIYLVKPHKLVLNIGLAF